MCLSKTELVLSLVENVVSICNGFIVSIFDFLPLLMREEGLPLDFGLGSFSFCPAHQVGFSHCVSGHLELGWGRAASNEG